MHKKLLIGFSAVLMVAGNAWGLGITGDTIMTPSCILNLPTCGGMTSSPDSSCNTICTAGCSGTTTARTGYIWVTTTVKTNTTSTSSTASRSPQAKCADDGSTNYSCYCGVGSSIPTLTTIAPSCDAGYYGTASYSYNLTYATDSYTGCSKCPSLNGEAGNSVIGSNTSITDCFVTSNPASGAESYNDGTGDYTFTSDCYYK